jgi:plasmid stabilization system protein ParE
MPETPETDPARIVADADVLAADLLVGDSGDASGNAAREAMDAIRSHSWLELVASDDLLDDAEAVIRDLADPDLATAWRERIEALRVEVEHPAGDHPALASAYRGRAAHLLSYDEGLRSAEAGATFGSRLNVSVKTPAGFAALFDAESLYEAVEGGEYPGPDRDPRE